MKLYKKIIGLNSKGHKKIKNNKNQVEEWIYVKKYHYWIL